MKRPASFFAIASKAALSAQTLRGISISAGTFGHSVITSKPNTGSRWVFALSPSQRNRQTANFSETLRAKLGIAERAVDAGTDGGSPHIDLQQLGTSLFQVTDAVTDHYGIGTKLLTKGHRHGILIFRAAHFQHAGKFGSLSLEASLELAQSRDGYRAE
jgi:hypothetical protein